MSATTPWRSVPLLAVLTFAGALTSCALADGERGDDAPGGDVALPRPVTTGGRALDLPPDHEPLMLVAVGNRAE